jgi:flotillin
MMQTVPPLNDLFKMAGMELPAYLKGEMTKDNETKPTGDDSNLLTEEK